MQAQIEKVILVFGGAGGIGAEAGARLALAGARVVIADLDAAQAQAKAAGIVAVEAGPSGWRATSPTPPCASPRHRLRSISSANSMGW